MHSSARQKWSNVKKAKLTVAGVNALRSVHSRLCCYDLVMCSFILHVVAFLTFENLH